MRESHCSVAKRLRTAKDARCILFDRPPPLCLFSSDQRQVCRSESFPQPMWPGTRQGTLKSPANREHDREWPKQTGFQGRTSASGQTLELELQL